MVSPLVVVRKQSLLPPEGARAVGLRGKTGFSGDPKRNEICPPFQGNFVCVVLGWKSVWGREGATPGAKPLGPRLRRCAFRPTCPSHPVAE